MIHRYLKNDWTDLADIWHVVKYRTADNKERLKFGPPLHVRTCEPPFCISRTTGPIGLKFGT